MNRLWVKSGFSICLFSMFFVQAARTALAGPCPGDLNGDDAVTVDELVRAVNSALIGCGPGPWTPAVSTLLQTGQKLCDQGSGTLGACPGSPAGQDGAVGAGEAPHYTDNGDGTVVDNATGLTWEKLSDDDSVHDWDRTYTWYEAFHDKIAVLNTPPCFAGHCDWRLPNRREMESLVHADRVAPAVHQEFDSGCTPGCEVATCSCTQLDVYWTSTTFHDLPEFAWTVDGNLGAVNWFEKALPLYVRAVRGGLRP